MSEETKKVGKVEEIAAEKPVAEKDNTLLSEKNKDGFLRKTGRFFKKNGKTIVGYIAGVATGIGGILLWQKCQENDNILVEDVKNEEGFIKDDNEDIVI